jgi:hypothetical protein
MGLLYADLRALGNLPTTPAGRRLATSTGVGLLLLALMSWWGFEAILSGPLLLQMLEYGTDGDSLRGLLGFSLMPCPIVATWLGLAIAQRQLFDPPELLLWQAAPLPRWRPAVQVLLRACFLALLWASAFSLPLLATLLSRTGAPFAAYALVPLALLACTAPLLASLLIVQIVLVRFFAGRVLRLVLALLGGLASVGFSTWLLIGLFTPGNERVQDLAEAAAAHGRLPVTIDTTASLLAGAARGQLDPAALARMLGWLLATAAAYLAAAHLHPGAVEKHQLGERPLLRTRRSRWPSTVTGTIRRKEIAQVLQQPGALIGFLVFGFLVVTLVRERVLVSGILSNSRLPRDLAHLGAMLAQWFLAVLLVLYAHMGRLAMWDGTQWPLYMGSPTRPATILLGKLQAVALFLLWPLLLVAAAGSHLLGASPTTLGLFVALALAGTAAALGVLAVVGTWPRLMRPDDGGQIVQGGRSFLAAMLLVVAFETVLSPAVFGWWYLTGWLMQRPRVGAELLPYAPWVVGAAWVFGLAIGGLGFVVGTRNYRRLLQPR